MIARLDTPPAEAFRLPTANTLAKLSDYMHALEKPGYDTQPEYLALRACQTYPYGYLSSKYPPELSKFAKITRDSALGQNFLGVNSLEDKKAYFETYKQATFTVFPEMEAEFNVRNSIIDAMQDVNAHIGQLNATTQTRASYIDLSRELSERLDAVNSSISPEHPYADRLKSSLRNVADTISGSEFVQTMLDVNVTPADRLAKYSELHHQLEVFDAHNVPISVQSNGKVTIENGVISTEGATSTTLKVDTGKSSPQIVQIRDGDVCNGVVQAGAQVWVCEHIVTPEKNWLGKDQPVDLTELPQVPLGLQKAFSPEWSKPQNQR